MPEQTAAEPATPPRSGRPPLWLTLLLGLLAAGLGVVLLFRPFASLAFLVVLLVATLALTGIGELLVDEGEDPAARRLRLVRGALFLVAALVVVLWPGPTLRVVAVIVGLTLLVGGVLDLPRGLRSRGTTRWSLLIGGVASVVLGALALAWPDVTVLVIAVVVGLRTVMFGVRLLVLGLRRVRHPGAVAMSRPKAGWRRLVGAGLSLLVALPLLGLSQTFRAGAPVPDGFYDAPEDVPAEPGRLLRAEPFDRAVPDGAQAWRILYTTTRAEGEPAVASGLVVAPRGQAGPAPVVAWAHGTTGAAPGCAPSLLENPFEAGAFFSLDAVVEQGWVLVATDYVGLGTEAPHPYLVGEPEGRSVLDAVRAARQLDELDLTEQNVVWGHSQGGGAALWTGILAPDYAPELDVVGVAALAPASNLTGLVPNLGELPGGALFASYVVQAYSDVYDDVSFDEYVRPGVQVLVREMAGRCLAEPGVIVSLADSLVLDGPIWRRDPTTGPLGERLAENTPSGPIEAPLLLGQGEADQLVLPSAQEEYVRQRCEAGFGVDYRTYEGRDHVPLVEPDSPAIPELFEWTRARLAGEEPLDTCRVVAGR